MRTQIWHASWSPGLQGNQVRKGPTLQFPPQPKPKEAKPSAHTSWGKYIPDCTSLPSQLVSPNTTVGLG